MPRFTYTVLFYILSPIYFFRLFIRGFSNSSYLLRWNERVGLSHLSPTQGKDLIWIHAVSVGEVNASIPLLRKLMESHPLAEFLVTTSTPTGSDVLLERIGSRIRHQYLPIDLPFCIGRFLNNWNPKILIILETEIWPNLISCCKERGISTALVNARLSKKSRDKYLRFVSLIAPAISNIDLILAQFESDKQRFISLSDDINIALCGNLKFDQNIAEEMNSIVGSIRSEWSIEGKQRPTLIAASTHDTEETAIIAAFKIILSSLPAALLILVPRHLERFKKVHSILRGSGLIFAQRSKKEDITPEINILFGDTMGELNFLYSISDAAFVGGSLIDHGGQNLLEPASLGLPLISGPSLRNFQEIADQLQSVKALNIVNQSSEIASIFIKYIENEKERAFASRSAKEIFLKNRGALQTIEEKLQPFLRNISK